MAKGKVYLVGGGPGDPGLITLRGIECLQQADLVLYDRLINPALLRHARPGAEVVYVGKAAGGHALSQQGINDLLVARAQAGDTVVRLKGGDPFVFGRGGEEALALVEAGVPFEVVPGISSSIAAPAYAGIPVTHRNLASSFAVITGHEDPTKPDSSLHWEHLAKGVDTLVFLMGLENLPLIVEQLVANGRPPETPIALVRWGTWARQETLTGTLSDIQDKLQGRAFSPPVATIVGPTVPLREQIAWFDNRPLSGVRVLVTRAREQASQLAAQLAALGAEPVEAPAIEIAEPDDYAPLDEALRGMNRYRWVVFTSANGVQAVFRRLQAMGKDSRALAHTRIAAVGPGTAAALRERSVEPDLIPDAYLTEAVAEALIRQGVKDTHILLPRADIATELLAQRLTEAGALLTEVTAYRTVQAGELDPEVAQLLAAGQIDIVTFASASTVRNLVALLGGNTAALARCRIASIGPVTTEAARAAGLSVDIEAVEHTIPGLVAAIKETWENNQLATTAAHPSTSSG